MAKVRRHWLPGKSEIEPSLGLVPVKISPRGENAQPSMRFGQRWIEFQGPACRLPPASDAFPGFEEEFGSDVIILRRPRIGQSESGIERRSLLVTLPALLEQFGSSELPSIVTRLQVRLIGSSCLYGFFSKPLAVV